MCVSIYRVSSLWLVSFGGHLLNRLARFEQVQGDDTGSRKSLFLVGMVTMSTLQLAEVYETGGSESCWAQTLNGVRSAAAISKRRRFPVKQAVRDKFYDTEYSFGTNPLLSYTESTVRDATVRDLLLWTDLNEYVSPAVQSLCLSMGCLNCKKKIASNECRSSEIFRQNRSPHRIPNHQYAQANEN